MARLQDLRYDGDHVFSPGTRRFLDGCTEKHHYYWPIIKSAEQLTEDELYWLWIEAMGAFETTHPDYQAPPKELVERAGPVAHYFTGYGDGMCGVARKVR